MTDNYRSELFSRIRKLNFSHASVIGQMLRLFLLFLAFFSLFFCIGYVIKVGDFAQETVCDLFCSGFKNSEILELSQKAFAFASSDFLLILIVFASGYTMLAAPISTLCLTYAGAKYGFCFSSLWKILIDSNSLSGGGAAFAYLAVCKLCVLVTLFFVTVCSRNFSYRYSDIYRRSPRPLSMPESTNYSVISLSSAGFSVLINLTFMFFVFISPLTRM